MLELVHAATGGIIAYKIGSPLVSLPLALLSHAVLDLLPHWNPSLTKEKKKSGKISSKTILIIFFDCLIGLILGLKIASLALPDTKKAIIVVFGCLAGILPDLIEAPYFFLNKNFPLLKGLISFQSKHQWNVPFVFGVSSQILLLILLFYFL